MKVARLIAALVFAALLATACGGGDDGGGDAAEPAGGGGGDAGGSSSVSLVTENFAFSPPTLSVAAGGSIEVSNEDDAPHTFTAEDAGIDQELEPGSSSTVDLADVEAGSYDFVCKLHPDMKGTLEVTE